MPGASKPASVFTKQQRIAELAKQSPQMSFTSLAYHMDIDWLHEAYRRTRRDGAAGVDEQTAADFAANLQVNLQTLLDQAKSGTYWAPPVRRVQIPKGSGTETRSIGIPTFADKVLQRAVVMVLEAVYEQDFLDCSYGFRPRRSAHQALEALRNPLMDMGGGWVVEVDIRKFFDTLDRTHLREFLQRRVRDGVLTRLIGKWLKAGVLEEGTLTYPEAGTPQGGVISPLLANIYLHYVLDEWFEREVKPRLHGRSFLIRYADDFVMAFANEADAQRVMEVLPKRFAKYGLSIHSEKTRRVPFRRPGRTGETSGKAASAGTFDLLGFTHYWGRSRRGFWVVKRRTAADRFRRALRKIADWCRRNFHRPLGEQQKALGQKLRGHDAYYGITGNSLLLARFRYAVMCLWRKWLCRRHRQTRLPWARYLELLKRFPLPPPRVVHSVYRLTANP